MKIDDFDLKRCPICGYKPKLYYMGYGCYAIRCGNKDCKTEHVVSRSIYSAMSIWNKSCEQENKENRNDN